MASSTTRPTAIASPPRVMMLIVTPATSISISAVMIETGMLTAATSVDRRLSRKTKIVMIAKRAPRPPSRTRLSRDSMMKLDESETMSISKLPLSWAWSWSSLAWTAWTTSTVLASEVLVMLRTRAAPAIAVLRILVQLGVAGRVDRD